MAPTRVELVFTLPDSQLLTFSTSYSILLDPPAWQSLVRTITEQILWSASIDLSGFQRGLCAFSRRANRPSFLDPDAVLVLIHLWVVPYDGDEEYGTDYNSDADSEIDGDSDDEAIDDGSDSDSESGSEAEQRVRLYYLVDEFIQDSDSAAMNQALEQSFQESQDHTPSFGGLPASKEALRNLIFFTVEEREHGAAGTLCSVFGGDGARRASLSDAVLASIPRRLPWSLAFDEQSLPSVPVFAAVLTGFAAVFVSSVQVL